MSAAGPGIRPMPYALFLDDEREPPVDGRTWLVARSSAEALDAVRTRGWPDYASFDHDLGGGDTAMAFLHAVIDTLLDRNEPLPFAWTIHSQNPVGRANIAALLAAFERHHI